MAYPWDDLKRHADDLLDGGDLEKASRAAERALALAEQAGNPPHPDVAEILHALGAIRRRQGLHAQAEAFHRRALELDASDTYRGRPGLGAHLFGMILLERGKNEEAARVLESAEAHDRDAPGLEALTMISRVDAELAQGHLVEAEELVWKAMGSAVQARDDYLILQLLLPVVDLHLAGGRDAELAFMAMGVAILHRRLDGRG